MPRLKTNSKPVCERLCRDPAVSAARGEKILARFADRTPFLVIELGRIEAEDYEITLSGRFDFNAFPRPVGSFTIQGTNVDKAIKMQQRPVGGRSRSSGLLRHLATVFWLIP